jgi:hypothetical protein
MIKKEYEFFLNYLRDWPAGMSREYETIKSMHYLRYSLSA